MFGMLNPMSAVTSQLPGAGGGDDTDKEKEEEAERERLEAIAEAEDRRKEKHRKMEEEREDMRQGIRDKYNIKKKVEEQPATASEPDNPLMRRKKTPEEMAAEAEMADQDEFTNRAQSVKNLNTVASQKSKELKNSLETQVNEIKQQIEERMRSMHVKCRLFFRR